VAVSEYATNPAIPFEDKPYIVADTTKSRYAGNLYVGLDPVDVDRFGNVNFSFHR